MIVKKNHSFNRIEKEWDALYKKNSVLSYYQSTEYMKTLWKNIIPYCFILRVKPVFYSFKKSFYKGELNYFYIGKRVYGTEKYNNLRKAREIIGNSFFPEYRESSK